MPGRELLTSTLFPQIYELRVMETKPDKAVSIIECDMNVSDCPVSGSMSPEKAGGW